MRIEDFLEKVDKICHGVQLPLDVIERIVPFISNPANEIRTSDNALIISSPIIEGSADKSHPGPYDFEGSYQEIEFKYDPESQMCQILTTDVNYMDDPNIGLGDNGRPAFRVSPKIENYEFSTTGKLLLAANYSGRNNFLFPQNHTYSKEYIRECIQKVKPTLRDEEFSWPENTAVPYSCVCKAIEGSPFVRRSIVEHNGAYGKYTDGSYGTDTIVLADSPLAANGDNAKEIFTLAWGKGSQFNYFRKLFELKENGKTGYDLYMEAVDFLTRIIREASSLGPVDINDIILALDSYIIEKYNIKLDKNLEQDVKTAA